MLWLVFAVQNQMAAAEGRSEGKRRYHRRFQRPLPQDGCGLATACYVLPLETSLLKVGSRPESEGLSIYVCMCVCMGPF